MRLLAIGAWIFVATTTVAAQTSFLYNDFSSTIGLTLNGATTISPTNTAMLTTATNSLTGAMFTTVPVTVLGGFDTQFQFRITPVGQGADGMTFVIQNSLAGAAALGGAGSDLAYGGLTPIDNSIVVELDTYLSGAPYSDTSGNEISIHTNGTAANSPNEASSIGRVTPAGITMADGAIHTMRILYAPGTLSVFLDNLATPVLSVPYDFQSGGNYLVGGAVPGIALALTSDAYVGFTAATGGLNESHEVLSWSWVSTGLPDACFAGSAPTDLLTVNGATGGVLRTVTLPTYSTLSIDVANQPAGGLPSYIVLWGYLGYPTAGEVLTTPFGSLCFSPQPLNPTAPWLFTLADSFGIGIPALFPAFPGPMNITIPNGVPISIQFTLQALVLEQTGGPLLGYITNGIMVDIVPSPAPTITTLTPVAGLAGSLVTVTGTGFLPAAGVTMGGIPAPIISNTGTVITCMIPGGVACGSTLVVTNPDGQSVSRPFNANPSITSTVFPSGPAAGNATYVIIGSGWGPGTTVTVGGNAAIITNITATTIVTKTPPGVVGPAQVVVTTPAGCFTTTTYTYL